MNLFINVKRTSLYCDAMDYEFYKQVTAGSDPYAKPFPTMYDAFIAFASVGFHYESYVALPTSPKSKEELTLASYLANDKRLWTLAALAYARLKKQPGDYSNLELARQVLDTANIIPLVEGWANGGAKLIKSQFLSGDSPDNRTLGLADALLRDLG